MRCQASKNTEKPMRRCHTHVNHAEKLRRLLAMELRKAVVHGHLSDILAKLGPLEEKALMKADSAVWILLKNHRHHGKLVLFILVPISWNFCWFYKVLVPPESAKSNS